MVEWVKQSCPCAFFLTEHYASKAYWGSGDIAPSNPVSIKKLTAIETSTIVKLLRPCVPVGTKRTIRRKVQI
jgi:hypothetical protein